MLCFKVPAKYDELDQDQQEAECNCELPERKRKVQAEYIRNRRDRRGPQISFCDQTDAQ